MPHNFLCRLQNPACLHGQRRLRWRCRLAVPWATGPSTPHPRGSAAPDPACSGPSGCLAQHSPTGCCFKYSKEVTALFHVLFDRMENFLMSLVKGTNNQGGLLNLVEVTKMDNSYIMISVWRSKRNSIRNHMHSALAGVAQWTQHLPMDQKVSSSIPSQGTCLGFGPGHHQLGACERQPHIDVSLPFFPSLPFTLEINKI